ncbi:hypothetical protein [Candidatus Poriferisocius sp.]|uniref:hypothetical protein n=1 Tax=Candidatus Poriferisocius sp. TaxID=3101276 RepID=UPI003B0289EA
MNIRVFAVVVVVAVLGVGAASAQSSDSRGELIAAQEVLIAEQRELIEAQEELLNEYRCLFGIDTRVVPDRCGLVLTPLEEADVIGMCSGWLAETETAASVVAYLEFFARIPAAGVHVPALPPGTTGAAVMEQLTVYAEILSSIIPTLESERISQLLTSVTATIDAVVEISLRGGLSADRAAHTRTGLEQFNQLQRIFTAVCL